MRKIAYPVQGEGGSSFMITYVLDTSVVLYDPGVFEKFSNSKLILPVSVLEELDQVKRHHTETGKNIRHLLHMLHLWHGSGQLFSGVTLKNGSTLVLQKVPSMVVRRSGLEAKLELALLLKNQGEQVVFLSKNFLHRVRAHALGLAAEDYQDLRFSADKVLQGVFQVEVSPECLECCRCQGGLKEEQVLSKGYIQPLPSPNQYFFFYAPEERGVLTWYDSKGKCFEIVRLPKEKIWGISPLNIGQQCGLDLILSPRVQLVTLVGSAGTGKTLLTLAAAMFQVFTKGSYEKILVSRPVLPLGKDIGYLPGTKEEKLYHWMQPIYDNLEVLCRAESDNKRDILAMRNQIIESERFEVEAVTYIRGRSLVKTLMIIDEAQNLTPHEIKAIISRAGKGSKVVLTGDISQIDHPYLAPDSNALTYTLGHFLPHNLFGHMYLEMSERSELAALASKIL